MLEHVVLVDEQDNPIGFEEKMRAHELGLLHRAFSVFVFRRHKGQLEFLLQQRHADKYHCGNLWTNTCCSHPRLHETVVEAARRRLKEEMSLDIPLSVVGSFIYRSVFSNGLTEYEYDHVLVGEYREGMPVIVDPKEVQNFAWLDIDTLQADFKKQPHCHTHSISSCDEAPTKAASSAYDLICEQEPLSATKSQLERRRVYTPWFKLALDVALEQLCINS